MTDLSEEKQITRPSEIDRFSASTPIHGDPTSRGCPTLCGGPRQRGPDQLLPHR